MSDAPRPTPPPRDYSGITPTVPEGDLALSPLDGPGSEVEVEIGYGRGMFLLQRAAAAPSNRIYGFEIKKKWAFRVAERVAALGLDNATAYCGDIREVLPRLRPDGGVARVFMHFPDPWWKAKHEKRRLLSGELLAQCARLLRPGGEFYLQTDVEERAEGYVEAFAVHADFELAGQGGYLTSNPYGAVSNREKRADEDGLPVSRVLARRR